MTSEEYSRVMDLLWDLEKLGIPQEVLMPVRKEVATRRAATQKAELESPEPVE